MRLRAEAPPRPRTCGFVGGSAVAAGSMSTPGTTMCDAAVACFEWSRPSRANPARPDTLRWDGSANPARDAIVGDETAPETVKVDKLR